MASESLTNSRLLAHGIHVHTTLWLILILRYCEQKSGGLFCFWLCLESPGQEKQSERGVVICARMNDIAGQSSRSESGLDLEPAVGAVLVAVGCPPSLDVSGSAEASRLRSGCRGRAVREKQLERETRPPGTSGYAIPEVVHDDLVRRDHHPRRVHAHGPREGPEVELPARRGVHVRGDHLLRGVHVGVDADVVPVGEAHNEAAGGDGSGGYRLEF